MCLIFFTFHLLFKPIYENKNKNLSLDVYFFIDASAMNCLNDVFVIKYSIVAFQTLFENIRHDVGKWRKFRLSINVLRHLWRHNDFFVS